MAVKELIVGKKYFIDIEGYLKTSGLEIHELIHRYEGSRAKDLKFLYKNHKSIKCVFFNKNRNYTFECLFEGMEGNNEKEKFWSFSYSFLDFIFIDNKKIEDYEV